MLELLANLIGKQKPDEGKGGGAKSWWRWPLLIVLVLAGLAIASWWMWRNGRELAKLRSDKFKREELARKAEVDAQVASNKAEADAALAEAKRQADRILELDLRIHAATRRNELDKANIDRLTWADLPRGK